MNFSLIFDLVEFCLPADEAAKKEVKDGYQKKIEEHFERSDPDLKDDVVEIQGLEDELSDQKRKRRKLDEAKLQGGVDLKEIGADIKEANKDIERLEKEIRNKQTAKGKQLSKNRDLLAVAAMVSKVALEVGTTHRVTTRMCSAKVFDKDFENLVALFDQTIVPYTKKLAVLRSQFLKSRT